MKPLLWSIRRELWEHRWLYVVPTIAGGVLIAVMGGVLLLAGSAGTDSGPRAFDLASRMIVITGIASTFAYCTEALLSERRDGSIVFWRALPVSDYTAVLGKAAVALLVVPLMTLGMLFAAESIAHALTWQSRLRFIGPLASPGSATLEVFVSVLWVAPVYAWVLLVSAWARRGVLLMAVLPPCGIAIVEAILTRRHAFAQMLVTRSIGRYLTSADQQAVAASGWLRRLPAPEMLNSWSLWIGALVAAAFIVAAVTMRRGGLRRS